MSWANLINNIFKTRNSYNIQPLKEVENYEMWFIRIRALLVESGLVLYITIQNYDIEFVIESQPSMLLFKKVEKMKFVILLNLKNDSLIQIQHVEKFYNIWQKLRNLYASKEFSNDFYFCKKFFNITLESCDNNIKDYINNLKRIND